jgi:tetratricopeptide (TPR) repeat protein
VAVIWFVNVPSVLAAHDIITGLSAGENVQGAIAGFQTALNRHSLGDQEIREQAVQYASQVAGDQAVSDADKTAAFQFAIGQMQQEVAAVPKDARLWLELAVAYRTAGDLQDARMASAQAQALSPSKQLIFIEQGAEALQAGDAQAAQQYFNDAYQVDPSVKDLAAYAASGDIFAGDLKDADALLVSAYGTTTPDNDLLVYAYYSTKNYARAIQIWQARTAANDTLENDFNLAALYLESGNKAAAADEVQHAITAHPEGAAQGQAFLQQIANTK